MRVFIVHAHHEPTSFNAAMTREGAAALRNAGHEVIISDLYGMGWDPVSDRRNFRTIADPHQLRQQVEEAYATEVGGYVPQLQHEMKKLAWCDALVLQYPMWWLGMPGILKGWIDRTFAVGFAYGGGRWFDGGMFAGKRAMISMTVGGAAPVYSDRGIYGPMETILHPIHRGILGFTGFAVVEPFIVYGPGRIGHREREAYLDAYRYRLLHLDTAPTIAIPQSDDYDGFIRKPAVRRE